MSMYPKFVYTGNDGIINLEGIYMDNPRATLEFVVQKGNAETGVWAYDMDFPDFAKANEYAKSRSGGDKDYRVVRFASETLITYPRKGAS